MKIPCVERPAFLVTGLGFLQPALTRIQSDNLTLIATALVLGAGFSLTEIHRMWLKEKSISTLSHFLSDAKFSTDEMQHLYALRVLHRYKIRNGYFIIDDTMMHRSNFCKWIHGVFILFDHALKTNLKAVCVVVLYYSDSSRAKCPLTFRIYYQESSKMPWTRKKKFVCKPKYDLAVEMLEWALEKGFPRCTVLADSWFGVEPFIKKLRGIGLGYVIEIKHSLNLRIPCGKPKLTPTGRLAGKQYDLKSLTEFFKSVSTFTQCGFAADNEKGKPAKTVYHAKIVNGRLNAVGGKHRIVESSDPSAKTVKYLLTDQLTWEATRIITVYSYRWVIEEFFRNAKQLLDMEGATVRSEQGVTAALCLVFCIDFLLHLENCKGTAEELSRESQTIPSIIRHFQYENQEMFVKKIQNDSDFVRKWLEAESGNIYRERKKHKQLIVINRDAEVQFDYAA